MSDAQNGSRGIAVITVHGTGDTAESASGQKWFQNGSEFAAGLQGQLGARGLKAEIHPHLWSGANSGSEREKAARSLAKLIRRLARAYEGVHVIAHSHGGNVANDAACMLNWSRKRRRPKLASVTTVGTPFFRTQVSTGEALGSWVFGAMALISAVLLPVVMLLTIAALSQANEQIRVFAAGLLGVTIFGAVALLFVIPLAFRGIARIRRANRRPKQDTSILAIHHPEDEAISFLRRVEGTQIEAFSRGAVFRGSRTGAIVWGVRAVMIQPLLGGLLMIADLVIFLSGQHYIFPHLFGSPLRLSIVGLIVILYGLAAAPVLFGGVYLIYRLVAGSVGEFAFRKALNNVVGGALRGLAFGRDGDNRLGDVSSRSHYYATLVHALDGEVAARMAANSVDASRRLFERYRRGVFDVHAQQSDVLNEIAHDALTWDALVHTTYFDQPEVITLCGDYISSVAHGLEPQSADSLRTATLQECPARPRRKRASATLTVAAVSVAACVMVGAAGIMIGPYQNRDQLARERAQMLPPPAPYVVGQDLRDCDECPELVVIPGGVFTMGSPMTEAGRADDEGPLRRVTVASFAVGRYEVTYAQWNACVEAGGCDAVVAQEPWGDIIDDADYWHDDDAVAFVSWDDAQSYVRWLHQRTGQQYRLLSEAEWEYAARAGTVTAYPWGDQGSDCDRTGRGRCPPNAFGLYDMVGHFWEWTEDCYHRSYNGAPADSSAWTTEPCQSEQGRVVRDGRSFEGSRRSATRARLAPEIKTGEVSFRVARTL